MVRRGITIVLVGLTAMTAALWATSWGWPVGCDLPVHRSAEHETRVSVASLAGRLELSLSTTRRPDTLSPADMATHRSPAEVRTDVDRPRDADGLTSGTASDAARPWEPMMFDWQRIDLPAAYYGGGVARRLAVPYWFVLLAAGAWPMVWATRAERAGTCGGAGASGAETSGRLPGRLPGVRRE